MSFHLENDHTHNLSLFCNTSKTPEGRSATLRVQGLGLCFFPLCCFFVCFFFLMFLIFLILFILFDLNCCAMSCNISVKMCHAISRIFCFTHLTCTHMSLGHQPFGSGCGCTSFLVLFIISRQKQKSRVCFMDVASTSCERHSAMSSTGRRRTLRQSPSFTRRRSSRGSRRTSIVVPSTIWKWPALS